MSYAIKVGTLEATWIDQQATPIGHVRYDGEIVEDDMVWDGVLQNIRRKNQTEHDADAAAKAALDALLAQLNIDKADLAAQYQIGVDRLVAIRDTASFTNTTRDNAIRDLALITLRLARVVRALVI